MQITCLIRELLEKYNFINMGIICSWSYKKNTRKNYGCRNEVYEVNSRGKKEIKYVMKESGMRMERKKCCLV